MTDVAGIKRKSSLLTFTLWKRKEANCISEDHAEKLKK